MRAFLVEPHGYLVELPAAYPQVDDKIAAFMIGPVYEAVKARGEPVLHLGDWTAMTTARRTAASAASSAVAATASARGPRTRRRAAPIAASAATAPAAPTRTSATAATIASRKTARSAR